MMSAAPACRSRLVTVRNLDSGIRKVGEGRRRRRDSGGQMVTTERRARERSRPGRCVCSAHAPKVGNRLASALPRPMPLTLHSRVVASDEQVHTSLGDEAVILGLGDGVYYGLDAVGARVWSLLATPRRVSELVSAITREF